MEIVRCAIKGSKLLLPQPLQIADTLQSYCRWHPASPVRVSVAALRYAPWHSILQPSVVASTFMQAGADGSFSFLFALYPRSPIVNRADMVNTAHQINGIARDPIKRGYSQ
jgi:hypothetical protein